MASIDATVSREIAPGAIHVTWALGTADSGTAFQMPAAGDMTCHTFGTFGSATVVWQGSSDGTNWHAMTQKGGTAGMSYTAAANHTPNEMPPFIRPVSSGGTGTALTATLCFYPRYIKNQY